MRHLLITLTALAMPTIAFAGSDCGDELVKTAEVVMAIQTPEQFAAPILDVAPVEQRVVAPVQQIAPIKVETTPDVVEFAQSNHGSATNFGNAQTSPLAAPVAAYSNLLQQRISRGQRGLNLYDYAATHSNGELKTITAYTDYLAAQNPDSLNQADQIAYWANLYNALTLKVVVENYPVDSIRSIKSGAFSSGPWGRDAVTVNGKTLTLNDIEHEILRKGYPNPALVHYMVNCASIGCPNLLNKMWVGATLDADRAQAARDYINSPRGVKITRKGLEISSIYKWFQEDFGGSKSNTIEHLRKFAGPDLLAALDAGAKIDGYDYDWDLNE